MEESIFLLESYEALGTKWYIEVFETLSHSQKEVLEKEIKSIITSFENAYSRFKSDSLLMSLNVKRTVPYDDDLAKMLIISRDSTVKSDGLFTIFIQKKLTEKGYGEVTHATTHNEVVSDFVVTEKTISLTGNETIDLGGIGKGYLIDKLADHIRDSGIEQFLINGGGDMYVTHSNGKPIELHMQHPTNRDEVIGSLSIMNKAFCCSSSYVRMWEKDGVKQNHFISPDKKEIWAASYVIGETATSADIAATVLCLSSESKSAMETIATRFNVSYLVYDKDFNAFGDLAYETSTGAPLQQ